MSTRAIRAITARTAPILIWTALIRVAVWTLLTVLYLVGVAFAVDLFKSVAFVALISMFALILTDWGQFAASMAQRTAGDAHHDAEATRADVLIDFCDDRGGHRPARRPTARPRGRGSRRGNSAQSRRGSVVMTPTKLVVRKAEAVPGV